jgi:molybdate transport system ATP-binding protein
VDRARGLTTLAFEGGSLLAPRADTALGERVRLRIPAREVILADRAPSGLSLHNIVPATVASMSAEAESAYVVVQLMIGPTPLLAEVTRDAVERLPVRVGRELFVLIKSVALEL